MCGRDIGKLRCAVHALGRWIVLLIDAGIVEAERVELVGIWVMLLVASYAVPVDLDHGVLGNVHAVGETNVFHDFAQIGICRKG